MMERIIELLKQQRIEFLLNEHMSKHTSFKIGGSSAVFVMPRTSSDVMVVVKACEEFGTPYFILGNGTNLLVSDDGYNGVIIATKYIKEEIIVKDGFVVAPAGKSLFELNRFLKFNELKGMEWSFGIPGTVGGAVVMNAGAYGHEFSEFVHSVDVVNGCDSDLICLSKEELSFGHRTSSLRGKVVAHVRLQLESGKFDEISAKQTHFYNIRKEKQPLNYPSAGSIFRRSAQDIPAQIIDRLGLKNVRIGGAEVSGKHAGFIVNVGNATCQDVQRLIDHIKKICYNETGVILEEEVDYLR